jgi:hypothetical protein
MKNENQDNTFRSNDPNASNGNQSASQTTGTTPGGKQASAQSPASKDPVENSSTGPSGKPEFTEGNDRLEQNDQPWDNDDLSTGDNQSEGKRPQSNPAENRGDTNSKTQTDLEQDDLWNNEDIAHDDQKPQASASKYPGQDTHNHNQNPNLGNNPNPQNHRPNPEQRDDLSSRNS